MIENKNSSIHGDLSWRDFLYSDGEIIIKNRELLIGSDILGRTSRKIYSPKPDLALAPFALKPKAADNILNLCRCIERECQEIRIFIDYLKESCRRNAENYREELKEFRELISMWIMDHSLRSLDPVEVIGKVKPITRTPRSFIAVEVCFSGTMKHTLGSLVNASLLGYYGVVVTNDQMLMKALRLKYYLLSITTLKEINNMIGRNVLIVTDKQFLKAIKQSFQI